MQTQIVPEHDTEGNTPFDLQEELEYALEGLRIARELQSPYLIARAENAVKNARTALEMHGASENGE